MYISGNVYFKDLRYMKVFTFWYVVFVDLGIQTPASLTTAKALYGSNIHADISIAMALRHCKPLWRHHAVYGKIYWGFGRYHRHRSQWTQAQYAQTGLGDWGTFGDNNTSDVTVNCTVCAWLGCWRRLPFVSNPDVVVVVVVLGSFV